MSRLGSSAASPSSAGNPVPPPHLAEPPYRVVFVCTGNICRSPMAEVVTRAAADVTTLGDGTVLGSHLHLRSAGTGPWHEGEPMYPMALEALVRAGYSHHDHVARQFAASDLAAIDLVVALDRRHQQILRGLGADPSRLTLLRRFDPVAGAAADVPDPYYGDGLAFDDCLAMISAACSGLVASLAAHWESLWAAGDTRRPRVRGTIRSPAEARHLNR